MENKYSRNSVANIKMTCEEGKTILKDVYFTSPLKIITPFRTDYGLVRVMLLSSSSGIMSGDRYEINVDIGKDCRSEITSQSYDKIHKMEEGHAERYNNITVDSGAILNYMPQPTIPFKKSAYENVTKINLKDETSKLIYHEILSAGRIHHADEKFEYTYFKNLTDIYVGDKHVYRDNTYFDPKMFNMEGFGMYEGYTHLSNVVVVNFGDGKELMTMLRDLLSDCKDDITYGVTITDNDDVVIRMFGYEGNALELINTKIVTAIMERENAAVKA